MLVATGENVAKFKRHGAGLTRHIAAKPNLEVLRKVGGASSSSRPPQPALQRFHEGL